MSTVDASGTIHDAKGRFAGRVAGESDSELAPAQTGDWKAERAAQLASMGYVAPISVNTNLSPATSSHRRQWWANSFLTDEYGHAEGDFRSMPDDATPKMTAGMSLDGNRRTHRMRYQGAGVDIRMPSKAAINRTAKEFGPHPFKVPLTITTTEGRTVHGHVAVVRGTDGTWSTQPLGFDRNAGLEAAEGVRTVLEGQRARTALAEAGDLTRRYADRIVRRGAPQQAVKSSWIQSVTVTGDEDNQPVMVVTSQPRQLKDGTPVPARHYGYRATLEQFRAMATSTEPGREFNRTVRGKLDPVTVTECPSCHRLTARPDHTCPTSTTTELPREPVADPRAEKHRSVAASMLARFRRRT